MKQSLDGLLEYMFVSTQVYGNNQRHSRTVVYFCVSSLSHSLLGDHTMLDSGNGCFEIARNRQFVNIYHI